ncbi:MAG: class I SAM-dependent methyltransferase [Planctomycetia bacterium]|nr:class I SAM-dependent methyltransferase [Planctomycetia bacterium]
MTEPRAAVYDSLGSEYDRAFAVFLAHTDQKDKAHAWLEGAVAGLPARRLFIDAGAGTGKVTAWFTGKFERTIAIEPNPHLRAHLERNCPTAKIVPAPILDCVLPGQADFVLVSHVFYYIPPADWQPTLDRLASFVGPAGMLILVLQNPGTDCMGLVQHFHGRRFDLPALCRDFQTRHAGAYRSRIETVACHIETAEFDPACTVAEFMLNLLPLDEPPLRADLEAYVRGNFAAPGGGYRFSCSQDFLVIERHK